MSLRWAARGRERRLRSLDALKEVLAEVRSGMTGPSDLSNMAIDPEVNSQGT